MLHKIDNKLKSIIKKLKQPDKVISPTSTNTISMKKLQEDIEALELPNNCIVFIHSGFKSLGSVDGGPETVVEALIEGLVKKKNITIAMPSFSISGTMLAQLQSGKKFNVKTTATVFRAIPEAFLAHPEAIRSIHPTHSVAAIGEKAKWLTEGHHTTDKTFGPESPFGRLLSSGGFLIGLGSGLGTVTFYHTLEDHEVDFPREVYTNESFDTVCIDLEGKKHIVKCKAHDPKYSEFRIDKRNSKWLKDVYTHYFENFAGLKWQKVGKAQTWICNSQSFYGESKSLAYAGLTVYSNENDMAHFVYKSIVNK